MRPDVEVRPLCGVVALPVRSRTEGNWQSRWLQMWHLLSLDAPTVAVAWTWWVAHRAGIALPMHELAAMFLAVWVLYAADRLLDARAEGAELEARHHFHWRYRRGFRFVIMIASLELAWLLTAFSEPELARYAVLGALLAGWFVIIHTGERPLPKEFAVGLFFAAAVFVPTVVRRPELRPELLAPAILLALLASLNGLFIFVWEQAGVAHAATRLAAGRVVWIGLALGVVAAFAAVWAVAFAALLLVGLHLLRERLEATTLRALADLMLVLPVLAGMAAR